MATNLVVNFIGNNKLSKTTAVVSNDLKKLQKTTDNVGRSMSKALGAVGLGLGISALTGFLKQSAKAASDDAKAKNQLALALRNSLGATDGAIAGAEKWIQKTSNSVAVLDDELRPALATATTATQSLAKGQKLVTLALDISASKGLDLGQVTNALSKAYGGSLTSLKKLLPGVQLGSDYMARLTREFSGAADQAAKDDPYKRITVIFENLKETIGAELLPVLQQFATYLASPAGQANLQQVVSLFVSIGRTITDATKFLFANMAAIKAIIATLVILRLGWTLSTATVKLYMLATNNAVNATKLLKVALATTGIGALVVGVGLLAEQWTTATEAKEDYYYVQPTGVNSGEFDYTQVTFPGQIPESSDAWRRLGFEMYGAYVQSLAEAAEKTKKKKALIAEDAKKIREALNKEVGKIKSTAEKFRDAIGLAFGTFGKDENSVFNVDVIIDKMKRVVAAAKGFGDNLKKLRAKGATQDVIDEIVSMGAAQGNIVAKGLLSSGKLSTYLGLRGQMYDTGVQAGVQTAIAQTATYEIKLTNAAISAADIIREIHIYEKRNKKKYLAN